MSTRKRSIPETRAMINRIDELEVDANRLLERRRALLAALSENDVESKKVIAEIKLLTDGPPTKVVPKKRTHRKVVIKRATPKSSDVGVVTFIDGSTVIPIGDQEDAKAAQ